MGRADAELGSVAVELFDFVLKLCEDFCDAFAGCIIDDRHKFIAAVSSYEMLRGNRVSQQPGKVQNQLVADGVAEAVVDAFQVVHVKDDTGGRSFDEFHIVEQLFALALVRQSRVKVDVGFLFQLAVGTGNFDCGNRFICHLEIRLAHVYQIRRSVFSGSDLLNFIFQL